jgi:hypothetical protein
MGMIIPSELGLLQHQGFSNAAAPTKWDYVVPRFSRFLSNTQLTAGQQSDGYIKKNGVIGCLNRAYYGSSSGSDNSFLVGSWGKVTAIRPPRDVDVYFTLPSEVYHRFNAYTSNKQSALLQEVKAILQSSFPNTTNIRGDGPVVFVGFDSYCVEVVPAFELEGNRYVVCDTKNGGAYKETAPWHETVHIDEADKRNTNNLRPLVRMLKAWQAYCSVPIKSFHLELLAIEYIDQSAWRDKSLLWYDWLVRDFFDYLIRRANTHIRIPGTGELMWLSDNWKTKAESAHSRARYACVYEEQNLMLMAGDEWQKIFGTDIPRLVTL